MTSAPSSLAGATVSENSLLSESYAVMVSTISSMLGFYNMMLASSSTPVTFDKELRRSMTPIESNPSESRLAVSETSSASTVS